MTTYNKSTGNAGTLRQIITYSRDVSGRKVNFNVEWWILCSDPYTWASALKWTGNFAGTDHSGTVALSAGFGSKKVAEYSGSRSVGSDGVLTSAQRTFEFAIKDSGTSGLGGPTSFSKTISVPKIEWPAPSVPGGLSLSSPSAGVLRADYNVSSGQVDYYQFRYRKAGTSSWSTAKDSSPTYFVSFSGITPGGTYEVGIRAVGPDNSSGWSSTKSLTVKATAPSAPSTPGATSPDGGQARVTWSAPSSNGGKSISRYDLRYSVNDGSWVTLSGVSSPRTISGLTPGGKFEVQVRAVNADAVGGWSGTRTITLRATAPSAPGRPSLSSPAAGQFRCDWNAPSSNGGKGITGYDMRYRVNGGSWYTITNAAAPRTVSGLTPGGTAEVQVRAKNADETGGWSASASIVMKASAPGAPAAPAVTSPTPGEVRIVWSPPSSTGGKSITGYEVQYSYSSSFSSATTVTTSSPFLLAATPGQTLYARVRAKNADATGSWSAAGAVLVLSGLWSSDGSAWTAAAGVYAPDGSSQRVAIVQFSDGVTWAPAR